MRYEPFLLFGSGGASETWLVSDGLVQAWGGEEKVAGGVEGDECGGVWDWDVDDAVDCYAVLSDILQEDNE